MNWEDQVEKLAQVIAKAWADEEFKQRLLEDATAVFRKEGMEIPDNLKVRAMENTNQVFHFILPPKPEGNKLSEGQLEQIVGGTGGQQDTDSSVGLTVEAAIKIAKIIAGMD